MRTFLLCSILLLCGCKSEYKALVRAENNASCQRFFNDDFSTAWYNTKVDVYGKHLSGLLLIKKVSNQTYRTVFTNEAGVTFFDFEFTEQGGFTVKKVIDQLDRKAVINVLRNDFALLLGIPFKQSKRDFFTSNNETYIAAKWGSDWAYFVTDGKCESLQRLELASKRKKKVSIFVVGEYHKPESVQINHETFDMVIRLSKLERE
jgi:hypothetical protein